MMLTSLTLIESTKSFELESMYLYKSYLQFVQRFCQDTYTRGKKKIKVWVG